MLILLSGGASAAPAGSKNDAATNSLRPNGPVTITADRADWEQNGAMVYSGNVLLVSDTLKMTGDRLELRQFPGGEIEAKVAGNPARLDHPGLVEKNGQVGPPVSAQAKTLTYDSRSAMVDLIGGGRLTRGKDAVDGEDIRYDVAARRVRAIGGQNGQVKIVIQPPSPKGAAAPVTPTPATPAPAPAATSPGAADKTDRTASEVSAVAIDKPAAAPAPPPPPVETNP